MPETALLQLRRGEGDLSPQQGKGEGQLDPGRSIAAKLDIRGLGFKRGLGMGQKRVPHSRKLHPAPAKGFDPSST